MKRASVAGDDFHPDLRMIARLLPQQLGLPSTLPLLRALSALQGLSPPRDIEVSTLPSGAAVRLYRPAQQISPGPALLWIHGGGYVLGRARQDDNLCRRFVKALGATVASVDYRLAPEHRFPAALDDCYAATEWVVENARSIDCIADRVAVGGGSAGANL